MRRHGGLGLGLAIVRLIVDKHGGKVEVRSKEGRGTTFTVSIPITNVFGDASGAEGAAPVVHPVTKEPHTYMSGFEGRRILVVDDEADTLEMLKTVLSGTHAEVRACSNVIEALEVLKGWTPDALISDLDMPYEDGYALITKVRELELRSGNHVVSIALTAHVQVEDRERAFSFGFDAFVAKPVAPNELLATVCSHLLDAA